MNKIIFPHPNFKKTPKVFKPLRESQTQLYESFKVMGMPYPVERRPINPLGKFNRADHKCAYHSGVVGHNIENYSNLNPRYKT